ncbi:MAG: RagB/SusD family nutrient uptake outer membrane protein, partial [Cyclobacteriaceae bacterium]|nr:RagB/SusD family nutrient uptake outer membrane protein [Cyclobacteriaceae bacterium]
MKITTRIIITMFIVIVFTVSCQDSFLEVNPTGSITNAQLTSANGLEGTLIGAYSMLLGRGGFYAGSTNWLWGSVMGGEANKGTNSGDQAQVNEIQAYSPQATNESVLDKYRVCYEGIARVNALLRLLPDAQATVSAATKTRLEAEGKFLRAHYYFELKKIFNNVPYIDETIDYGAGIDEVTNTADIWPKIEADFLFAYNNLPEEQSAAGRANKWAAGAYLAKTYLYEGFLQSSQAKFQDAKDIFDDVIALGKTANGQTYGLLDKYGDLFRIAGDNSKESVFSIQAASGTGTINNSNPDFVLNFPYNGGPAGCCGFNQP